MLSPHRVRDPSSGGYLICAQILADLGANLVLVEPPDGSATRSEGPLLDDTPLLSHPVQPESCSALHIRDTGWTGCPTLSLRQPLSRPFERGSGQMVQNAAGRNGSRLHRAGAAHQASMGIVEAAAAWATAGFSPGR